MVKRFYVLKIGRGFVVAPALSEAAAEILGGRVVAHAGTLSDAVRIASELRATR
jgi:hypothetical protein